METRLMKSWHHDTLQIRLKHVKTIAFYVSNQIISGLFFITFDWLLILTNEICEKNNPVVNQSFHTNATYVTKTKLNLN